MVCIGMVEMVVGFGVLEERKNMKRIGFGVLVLTVPFPQHWLSKTLFSPFPAHTQWLVCFGIPHATPSFSTPLCAIPVCFSLPHSSCGHCWWPHQPLQACNRQHFANRHWSDCWPWLFFFHSHPSIGCFLQWHMCVIQWCAWRQWSLHQGPEDGHNKVRVHWCRTVLQPE